MDTTKRQSPICGLQTRAQLTPRASLLAPRRAFTLVELLVVITIIGILAALITAAGVGALKRAQQARIKIEVDQIAMALQLYKDTAGSYPPNCQVDDESTAATEPPATPLSESQVLTDLKRHIKQAFPRSRESDDLLAALVGLAGSSSIVSHNLPGGMTAGEGLVFWLGGFSADPKYPISGEGGPSYALPTPSSDPTQDALESRKWIYPFEVARLGPRDQSSGYFDGNSARYITYTDPQSSGVVRRINFWQFAPSKSEQPLLYFDTSRHAPEAGFDPPAATGITLLGPHNNGLHVHAIKMLNQTGNTTLPIQYANAGKFQILHAGIDDEWDDEDSSGDLKNFERMSYHGVELATGMPLKAENYLLFPDGPFTGAVADTITNFSEGTLEASQP